MASFTADSTTLNEVITAVDNAAKRAAVNASLGDGALTFTITTTSAIITGAFSGSLWGDAVLAVNDVEVTGVSGVGGALTGAYSLRVANAGGRYVEYPAGAITFNGPGGSTTVESGNEIRCTIRYEADVVPPPVDDLYIPVADLIATHEEASTVQPEFGTHFNDQAVIRSPAYPAIVEIFNSAPANEREFVVNVKEVYPWLFAYGASGHNYAGGKRLEMRRLKVEALRISTNQWTEFPEVGFGPSLAWTGNASDDVASNRIRSEVGSGNASFGPLAIAEGVEVWGPIESFDSREIFVDTKAWAWVCQVRVIDDAGIAYNGADAQFAIEFGGDQFAERGAPPDQYANRYAKWRADMGNGRFQRITGGEWQTIGFITMESYKQDENPHNSYQSPFPYDQSPYTLTRQQVLDNPPHFARLQSTSSSSFHGEYVDPDPNYVELVAPADTVRTLMLASDQPYRHGASANGWHRWATVNGGVPLMHERLHDWRDTSNLDDGGMFTGNIATARHTYNYARVARAKQSNGNCPKILPVNMLGKWMIAVENIVEVQNRYGIENEFGQIFNVTRYPSFPYGAHPPLTWDYVKEYLSAIYRPVATLGPGGEAGFGYTADDFPVVELGNEPKFSDNVIGAGRAWDHSNPDIAIRAFNLMTMQEANAGLKAIKEAVPVDKLISFKTKFPFLIATYEQGEFRLNGVSGVL